MLDKKRCKNCMEEPQSFVSDSTGHVILCRCGNKVQGYKREEWVIEEWNYWYGDK